VEDWGLDGVSFSGITNSPVEEKWEMSLIDQLTSLEGRINALRYILLSVGIFVAGICYAIVVGVLIFFLPEPIWTIVFTIFLLPVYYSGFSLNVKRLQDTGRGGGWVTYAKVCLVLSIIYGLTPLDSDIELCMGGIYGIVSLPLWIVCIFYKGEAGTNAFGPDPLQS
tara:strand:- start:1162 stop:1662 length:501 start_codon:yes stop_codon:yes gene_type:complete